MCGFVGDVLGGIVDVIGSVAEFVIDNALPIISTIAMNYIAPGFGSYLSSTFGLSKDLGLMVAKGIGSAAVSAINGGSLANIATAGLTPFIPAIGKSLGISLDPTGFINSAISSVLGNNVVSTIVSNAVGSATMAGVTAAVTGADILEAAGMAGLSGAVSSALSQTWDGIKKYAPTLSNIENNFKATLSQVSDLLPELSDYQDSIDTYNQKTEAYNDFIQSEDFSTTRNEYQSKYDAYQDAVARNDINTANSLANELNGDLGTKMNALSDQAESLFSEQQVATQDVSRYMNDSDLSFKIQAYDPVFKELASLQTQYDTFTNKIQADYSNFQMADALSKGDYTAATKYYTDLNNYNQAILKVEPNTTITTPNLTPQQNTFLQEFSSATSQAIKDELAAQASQLFADYRAPATPTNVTTGTTPTEPTPTEPTPVEPTPTEPTPIEPTPTEPPTDATTGTTTNPYDQLPTLPEEGIGQPTPPAPTTPTNTGGTSTTTTPSTGTGSNFVDYVTNVGGNILGNITQGVITDQIVDAILGNQPPTRPTITKPRPPAKVDVSTLRPYTGSLFGQQTTPTTPTGGLPTTPPAKVDPSTLTPYTGPLTFLGQTTPTTNTTTQTPSGGLQSNQPQNPPTKVDVSQLTPVTDTNLLRSLGIA